MYNINKSYSKELPNTFISLGNNNWYYNFDIKEAIINEPDEIDIVREVSGYSFSYVRIEGEPTPDKCYKAVLKGYLNEKYMTLEEVLNSPFKSEKDDEMEKEILSNIQIDFGLKEKPTELDIEKNKIIKEIEEYDTSENVNSFYLNGLQVWLDKSTRVGLMNSLDVEKQSGKTTSTLWFGNIKLNIEINAAIQMLSALELYALDCYNITASHKAIIKSLETIEDVDKYDYKTGYPDKLEFNV